MSSSEVLELVARLRPEGADETQDALEDTQETFEETADTAEESSAELEQFSERFRGALGVAATGLAIAAGGLLSTVPVISEAFGALGAIIQALGFRISGVLRPFDGIISKGFELANAIMVAEGPVADFASVLLTIVTFAGLVIGAITTAIGVFGSWAAAGAFLKGVFTLVAGAIGTVIGSISLLAVGIAALIVAVAAFAAAYITNWNNVRTVTNAVVTALVSFVTRAFQTMVDIAQSLFTILVSFIGQQLDQLVNDARQGANGLIGAFESWVNSAREAVVAGMNDILSTVEETVNDAIDALNKIPGTNISRVSLGRVTAGEAISVGRLGTTTDEQIAQQGRQERSAQMTIIRRQLAQFSTTTAEELANALPDEITTTLNLDGREIAKGTEQFRGAPAANRGR